VVRRAVNEWAAWDRIQRAREGRSGRVGMMEDDG